MYGRITAILGELNSPELNDRMSTYGDYHDIEEYRIEFKRWLEIFKSHGIEIWRVKSYKLKPSGKLELVPYRIFYMYHGYEPTYKDIFYEILAIEHKDNIDYDDTHSELLYRIISDYRKIFDGF